MTRTEVLLATGPASGAKLKVKMGCKEDGTLTAAEAMLAYEAGGFPGASVGAGARCMLAPYNIPNITIDGYDVVVNKPSTSAYRAPGAPISAFGAESVVNELAEKVGLDPLAFRLKNASKEGTRRADGPTFPRIGNEEVLQATMASDHWNAPLEGSKSRARNRFRVLGQWWWHFECFSQRECGWNCESCRRIH